MWLSCHGGFPWGVGTRKSLLSLLLSRGLATRVWAALDQLLPENSVPSPTAPNPLRCTPATPPQPAFLGNHQARPPRPCWEVSWLVAGGAGLVGFVSCSWSCDEPRVCGSDGGEPPAE